MSLLPWLRFDFNQIIESFNDLVREQFWLSVAVILVLLIILVIYLGTMIGSAVAQVRRLLPHLTRWYFFVPVGAAIVALFAVSVATVTYLRGTGLPVPSLSNLQPVLGEDQVLHWEDAGGGHGELMFDVEWSKDPGFSNPRRQRVGDSIYLLNADRNETLYWRVRAVKLDPSTRKPDRLGAWSSPLKVEQYRNVLEKIRRTRQISIAMENEFDRSIFRWYEDKRSEPDDGDSAGQAVSYQGVEIDLAYEIADEICRTTLDQQRDDRNRIMTCIPSRAEKRPPAGSALCKEMECVAVEVRITALGFEKVMQAVGHGQADMAISSITYKPEREKDYNILFGNQSYEVTGFGLVSRSSDDERFSRRGRAPDPAAILGRKVAVQAKTTSFYCMEWLQKRLAGAGEGRSFDITEVSRNVVALNMLMHNTAQFSFVVTDQPFAEGWMELEGGGRIQVEPLVPFFQANTDSNSKTPPFCLGQQYRIAVRAGEAELQELADRVVSRLEASGDLARFKTAARTRFAEHIGASRKAEPPVTATGSVDGR